MLNKFLISIIAIAFISLTQNSTAQETRGVFGGELFVFADFSPSTANAGDQVVFSWTTLSLTDVGSFCTITGVPGLSFADGSGIFTFTATTDLVARVFCEELSGFEFPLPSGSATAVLTVNSSAPPPTVNTSFIPDSILLGQSSTFNWSSTNATSCSSTGALSISGTGGSVAFQPSTTGNQTVTVTCTGAGGSSNSASTLSVQSSVPSPQVSAGYNPSFLFNPGFSFLDWSSVNANTCFVSGFGTFGPSGSVADFVEFSRLTPVSCTGAGGTSTAFAFIDVFNFFGESDADEKSASTEQVAGVMRVTDDALAQAADDSIDPLLDKVMLEGLGISLSDNNMSSLMIDLNLDDVADRVVFSPEAKTVFVLISDDAGEFNQVNKAVTNVNSFKDIVSVGVNIDGTVAVQMVK